MRFAAPNLLLLPISMLAALPGFEVASVKVTTDRAPRYGSITCGPNTLTMRRVSMWMALRWAYGVESFQMLAPEWTQTVPLYDILAKAPDRVTPSDMRVMLRTLLAERFHVMAHTEKKEMRVMALLVARDGPKFRETTGKYDSALGLEMPFQFLGFDSGVHLQAREDSGGGPRQSFTNISMPEFAVMLAMVASRTPFEKVPVIDMTGLKGRYDIALVHERPSAPPAEGLHLTGDDVLADYKALMQKQLGLTLEPRKAAVDVLVIENVERHPTPN
jgi:uncharacterized protein (TIGR03435 family)